MSERAKLDNARRKGRKAAILGLSIVENPMQASDSRYAWEEAYRAEMEKINNKSILSNEQNRHPVKWYTDVE